MFEKKIIPKTKNMRHLSVIFEKNIQCNKKKIIFVFYTKSNIIKIMSNQMHFLIIIYCKVFIDMYLFLFGHKIYMKLFSEHLRQSVVTNRHLRVYI